MFQNHSIAQLNRLLDRNDAHRAVSQNDERIRNEIQGLQRLLNIPDSPDRTVAWWNTPGNPESHLRDLRNEEMRRVHEAGGSREQTSIVVPLNAIQNARRKELNIFISATQMILELRAAKVRDAEQRIRDGRPPSVFNEEDPEDTENRRQALIRAEQEVLPLNERYRLDQEEEVRIRTQRLEEETNIKLQVEREIQERNRQMERENVLRAGESSEKEREKNKQSTELLAAKDYILEREKEKERFDELTVLLTKPYVTQLERDEHEALRLKMPENCREVNHNILRFNDVIDKWLAIEERVRLKSLEVGRFQNDFILHYRNLRISSLSNLANLKSVNYDERVNSALALNR